MLFSLFLTGLTLSVSFFGLYALVLLSIAYPYEVLTVAVVYFLVVTWTPVLSTKMKKKEKVI